MPVRIESAGASADVVLLDVLLPGMSGADVCRRMHQMAPAVPIIVVNALDAEVDVVLGLELGASDYVTKPYRQRELTARIQSVLHRARPPLVTSAVDTDVDRNRSEVIEAGPVSVNVGRREA